MQLLLRVHSANLTHSGASVMGMGGRKRERRTKQRGMVEEGKGNTERALFGCRDFYNVPLLKIQLTLIQHLNYNFLDDSMCLLKDKFYVVAYYVFFT